eukprot:gene44965-55966_t
MLLASMAPGWRATSRPPLNSASKIINTPGSEITGTRGGIHNSVTRI